MHYPRRSLKQYTVTTSQCGLACMIYSLGAICLGLVVIVVILVLHYAKRQKLLRTLKGGNGVPATMLIKYWRNKAAEQIEIENFTFRVHTPKEWNEIKDENRTCIVCLENYKKLNQWVVFDKCGHCTCLKCFKQIAERQKLYSLCPLCRSELVDGEGYRGLMPGATSHQTRRTEVSSGVSNTVVVS